MAEPGISTQPTPDTEQPPAALADAQEQATSPDNLDAALAANPADSTDPNAPIAPLKPVEPAGLPVPEEDELDELIIEDFTIDGICGVY
jgi:mycofactocin precursor